MATHTYLIALGSNRRHHLYGRPQDVLNKALAELEQHGVVVERTAPIIFSAPIGPSLRQYANGAAVIKTECPPEELLDLLKQVERKFGRRSGGQRWTSRVLDLDIVLWDGGSFDVPGLTIPHPLFRTRDFVLRPAATIAGNWRDPISNFTIRQLIARLTRPRPLPR